MLCDIYLYDSNRVNRITVVISINISLSIVCSHRPRHAIRRYSKSGLLFVSTGVDLNSVLVRHDPGDELDREYKDLLISPANRHRFDIPQNNP